MSTPSCTTVPEKSRAFAQRRMKPTDNNKSSGGGFLGFNADEVIETSSSDDDDKSNDYPVPIRQRHASPRSQRQLATQNRMAPGGIEDDVTSIDASDWSADEVFKYFENIFPQHAHVFKDHEIDGPSLYLL